MNPTPRERFLRALDRESLPGPVPHFELEFFLTMEAFGRLHSSQRRYRQWNQMTEAERELHRRDVADLYVATLQRFGLSGTLYNTPEGWTEDDIRRSIDHVRELSGLDYAVSLHGDATYSVPGGTRMMDFAMKLADDPAGVKREAQRMVDERLAMAERVKDWGTVDVFCLCSDYCFNDGPFLSPAMFDEFVTPYLAQLTAGLRGLGFYVIKHTDGNIMPILDALVSTGPHALHSLDPQGGVDLAEVKRLVGDQVALLGNVNCGLLQTGTEEEVVADIRRTLRDGMPGGGYVFSTSNCIYTGLPLTRYELMLKIWREEGVYP